LTKADVIEDLTGPVELSPEREEEFQIALEVNGLIEGTFLEDAQLEKVENEIEITADVSEPNYPAETYVDPDAEPAVHVAPKPTLKPKPLTQSDFKQVDHVETVATVQVGDRQRPFDTVMGRHFEQEIKDVIKYGKDKAKILPADIKLDAGEIIRSGKDKGKERADILTDYDRKYYKIAPHEVACWIRIPNWGNGVESDRPQEWLNNNLASKGGARIVEHPNGGYVRNGDCLLAVRHIKVEEAVQQRRQQENRDASSKFDNQSTNNYVIGADGVAYDPDDVAMLKKKAAAARNDIQQMLMGSSTMGISYEEALATRGLDHHNQQVAQNLNPGKSKEVVEATLAELKERQKANQTGKKSYAMGASFDKSGKLVRA